jgi:hypothetical protein
MKKKEIRTMIAADGERVDWLANLPTSIGDLNQLQQSIKTEFKESAVERCRQQIKHAANSEKGGAASVQVRRSAKALRNGELAREAVKLIAGGHSPHDVCGILAQRQELSTRQIRTILQDEGVLEKRRK